MKKERKIQVDQQKIPRLAWMLGFVFSLLIVALIIMHSREGYEHKTDFRYVGPESCKKCHPKQGESWSKTRMAKSFEVLKPQVKIKEKKMAGLDPDVDYTRDKFCLQCHTTAFGLVGGFISIEKTPEMAGVTCEACHGPGGIYASEIMEKNPSFDLEKARRVGLVYPPSDRICKSCHNELSPFVGMDYKFEYKKRVELGTHQHFELKYNHKKVKKSAPGR